MDTDVLSMFFNHERHERTRNFVYGHGDVGAGVSYDADFGLDFGFAFVFGSALGFVLAFGFGSGFTVGFASASGFAGRTLRRNCPV